MPTEENTISIISGLLTVDNSVFLFQVRNLTEGVVSWFKEAWERVFKKSYARWLSFPDLIYNIVAVANDTVLYT